MLKSLTSVVRWPEYVFISEGNPHLTSRVCRVELDSTHNSKMVSEPPRRLAGLPAI
ncbi:LCR related CCP, partial [Trifolium medium]|nr:LCR related CCP [Trifolium medium]